MLKHHDIWNAIDLLAQDKGLSASGLAKKAGLDSTSFNKSKRMTRNGRERWPSTESLAKILDATNSNLGDFLQYMGMETQARSCLDYPVLAVSDLGLDHFTPKGQPIGAAWDSIDLPLDTVNCFALEVDDGSWTACTQDGDILVVSVTDDIRRGDRIVFQEMDGAVRLAVLKRRTESRLDVIFNHVDTQSVALPDIRWVGRVLWCRYNS
jgi:phage repressor protein C with HTH and peptisase S24 domain